MSHRKEAESPADLAKRLGLSCFQDNPYLLARALTHTSYLNEHSDALDDNERLEFLGDAVLDFVVGAWLYDHCPEMREGGLTKARSALVRTETLADFARHINLGRALRLGKGEKLAGGAKRNALLCGAFEALIGAIYEAKDFDAVTDFFFPILEKFGDKIISETPLTDVKSRLQEWTQAHRMGTPSYKTLGSHGPDHAKVFETQVLINGKPYGTGSGKSKREATQRAAQETLKMLGLE